MALSDLTPPGRTAVMGIVNVTEDSFSDGGKWLAVEDALAHARQLVAEGADIVDVGGESTRPGATRVSADVEAARVVPVIRALAEEGIPTSVDTMRASTAEAAATAGVSMINDVSGGLADPDMFRVMSASALPVCLMHWRTPAGKGYGEASGTADHGGDVVADVSGWLAGLTDRAMAAGIDPGNILLDPGLGFSKSPEENWQILRGLPSLIHSHPPLLVGVSRKRFLAAIRPERGLPADPDPATHAVTALAAQHGVWGVRVHEVAPSRDAVDVARLWKGHI